MQFYTNSTNCCTHFTSANSCKGSLHCIISHVQRNTTTTISVKYQLLYVWGSQSFFTGASLHKTSIIVYHQYLFQIKRLNLEKDWLQLHNAAHLQIHMAAGLFIFKNFYPFWYFDVSLRPCTSQQQLVYQSGYTNHSLRNHTVYC
jgi:hypothetical protein